jgi:hypothetical protein
MALSFREWVEFDNQPLAMTAHFLQVLFAHNSGHYHFARRSARPAAEEAFDDLWA